MSSAIAFANSAVAAFGLSTTATLPSSRPTHSQHIPVCVYGLDRRDEGSRLRSRARADRTSSTPACRPLFIWPALAADVCARCSAMNNRSATKSLLAVARRENPGGQHCVDCFKQVIVPVPVLGHLLTTSADSGVGDPSARLLVVAPGARVHDSTTHRQPRRPNAGGAGRIPAEKQRSRCSGRRPSACDVSAGR